ncbi:MAG: hypothetical protein R6X17_00605, partial [Candidatus Competibacteraceae bacterium]
MSSFKSAGMSIILAALLVFLVGPPTSAKAASAAEIDRDASGALADLYRRTPAAKALAKQAKAILVFPTDEKPALHHAGEDQDRLGLFRQSLGRWCLPIQIGQCAGSI